MAKRRASRAKRSNWMVRMRCVVEKTVFCEDCTEEEAQNEPYKHATSEEEDTQIDWTVLDVKPND